ncbi:N-acetyl-gamma-glutamyl-phosphate reductase [Staphylospora marina]|uniref:N-acetyl-gamma-glutamyl-phosphate reductase n=1 Tax=Staphylospora marina TaxID=2490858 RepID=UPI000F5BEEB3|nr:N-acetyl-gamma-glutamyl-phosphate reductase [Staphylospora marina]
MKAAVIGSTGYGGAELIRLIEGHPELELSAAVSTSQAGEELGTSWLSLSHLGRMYEELDPERVCRKADLVFFATPPGICARWAAPFLEAGCIVIDLSADFRFHDPAVYEERYGKPPAPKEWLERAVYGLSEWNRERLREAELIANPGCYPTATLLALLPLLREGIVNPAGVIVDAKSGVTGAGRGLKRELLYCEVNENLRPYRVTGHPHTTEIEEGAARFAGRELRISFVPHLVPMNRGILVTVYASLMNKYTEKELTDLYRDAYRDKPFIRILTDRPPETGAVRGSNFCDIAVRVDERTGRVILMAAIDNLMKGAAGQAMQNANIRLGWSEETGLKALPQYP